jgi:hypothetical protein
MAQRLLESFRMTKPIHVALALATLHSFAHAGPAEDAAKELDPFFNLWETMRDDPGSRAKSLKTDAQVDACDAAIAKARKAGLADSTKLYSSAIKSLDEAEYDDKKQAFVTLGYAAKMCTTWRTHIPLAAAAAIQTESASSRYSYSMDPNVGSLGASMGDAFIAEGKKCLEVTDAALKAGAPPDHKVKIKDEVMSITEGRAKVCEAYLVWANEMKVKIRAAHREDREKRAEPYKKLGVAGEKLELFIEYDDVYWRGGANCQVISDVKAVAKAKVLFHWLENSDGTHTIRKYTFNGNKVGAPITKTFKDAGAAQRGCK